ncbi:MAG: hypothetical protein LC808_02985, partial [Actinobacteria bacterium]|nr:hypothetical protein [Actinomycetota bacterium]
MRRTKRWVIWTLLVAVAAISGLLVIQREHQKDRQVAADASTRRGPLHPADHMSAAGEAPSGDSWSEPVNGLSGRLRVEFEDL